MLARLWEDETTLVRKVPFVVRDHLLASTPATCFIMDHYRNDPSVALDSVRRTVMRDLIEESWRHVAPPRLVAEFDARLGRSKQG